MPYTAHTHTHTHTLHVQVFVEYASLPEAAAATKVLAGRTFGPNQVAVEYVSPDLYTARKFEEAARA